MTTTCSQPTSKEKVRPWPAKPQRANAGRYGEVQWMYAEYVNTYDYVGRKYESDRADAAMDRLRLAVKALEGCSGGWSGLADKALKQIGALPNDE